MPTYEVVLELNVDDDVKKENGRGGYDDEAYVSAELGWLDTSFAGVEIKSIEEVTPQVSNPQAAI